MLGDTNSDFKRKLLRKTEEKVRGYRSVALNHYCGNGYAFCVMISRKLGLEKALRAGHAVVFGGMPGGIPHPNRVAIPNPKIYQVKEALEKSGYNEERARTLRKRAMEI